MQSTMRSSFLDKKKNAPGVRKFNLKITPTKPEPISTRDYGLMRTSDKTSTPYPRVDLGVDANLLKTRLSMRRQIEIRRMSDIGSIMEDKLEDRPKFKTAKSKFVNVDRKLQTTPSSVQNLLSIGTPYPYKGVALNAHVLAKRLIGVNKELKQPDPPTPTSSNPSQTPRKKVVRLRESAFVHTSESTYMSDTPDGDRLSGFSQRVTQLDYSVSGSQMSVDLLETSRSFAERRKRLEEGEFTIARYGKKMSNMIMASTPLQHKVVKESQNLAKKANEEIEKYIQSQGLIKTSHDQLRWSHEFDWATSEGSMDSMRPHCLGDIYRDIKERKYIRSQTQQRNSLFGH